MKHAELERYKGVDTIGLLKKILNYITSTTADPKQWFVDFISGGNRSVAGVNVTEQSALSYSAVWACVRVISESIASLPLITYKRAGENGRNRHDTHPMYDLLKTQPNPEMTAFSFIRTLQAHVLTWGNGYAEIEFDNFGYPKALWPLTPNRVMVDRDPITKELQYVVTLPRDEKQVILRPENVFHIPGLGFDGIQGYSPIRMQMEAVGMGLALQEFGNRFFGNGTHLGGVVSHPGQLKDDTYNRLRMDLNEKYSGLGKTHRIMFLEEGMKFERMGIPPEEAQFLESRKFSRTEIAGIFRVPPHKIGDLERATFSNIEHQALEFVTDSLMPWIVLWEQTIAWKLLTPRERRKIFAEFLVEALLRGDYKTRMEGYAKAIQNGIMNRNEVRARENLNPVDGGEVFLVNGNMIPVNMAGQQYIKSSSSEKPGGEKE